VLESGFTVAAPELQQQERTMPKYVIEREIPNAGKLTQQELQDISQKSLRRSPEAWSTGPVA
jgi:hypothetical protein